jgi:hypothetical protein
MNTRIIFPRALKPFFWVNVLKFFDAGTGSGMENLRIRDGKIRIRDKHPGSGYVHHTSTNFPFSRLKNILKKTIFAAFFERK